MPQAVTVLYTPAATVTWKGARTLGLASVIGHSLQRKSLKLRAVAVVLVLSQRQRQDGPMASVNHTTFSAGRLMARNGL